MNEGSSVARTTEDEHALSKEFLDKQWSLIHAYHTKLVTGHDPRRPSTDPQAHAGFLASAKALERIQRGHYNTCQFCQSPIGQARLEVSPLTVRCTTCKIAQTAGRTFPNRT